MLELRWSVESRNVSPRRGVACHLPLAFVACLVIPFLVIGCGEPADDPDPTATPATGQPQDGADSSVNANSSVDADNSADKQSAADVDQTGTESDSPTTESTTATPAPASADSGTPPKSKVAVSETGSFFGKIVLDGKPPVLPALTRADDESLKDKEVCGMADVPDESLLIGDDNGIANVFLYLRRAPKGFQQEAPTTPVVLDQKGCIFTPHVALIQTGQPVIVKSSDGVQHNVHTFPARNQGVNVLIKPNDQEGIPLEYPRAESEPLQVKCDIHAWMASYHLVLDHPFMAATDSDGSFRIDGLPSGDYEFRVWHERAGLLERDLAVTVTGADEATELTYSVDQFLK